MINAAWLFVIVPASVLVGWILCAIFTIAEM